MEIALSNENVFTSSLITYCEEGMFIFFTEVLNKC